MIRTKSDQSRLAAWARDELNFRLTNHIPRRLASLWVGRISRSENPLIREVALWCWRRFSALDLSEAETTRFPSMQACFTRRLRAGTRPLDDDPVVLTSPCDAIVGAFGRIEDGRVLQVKGMDYKLADLLGDAVDAAALDGGSFVTLRLTSSMYHRFHAPYDCRAMRVRHIFGDRWNVNPPTLRRVRRLFCRNERVIVETMLPDGQAVTLVAVAAILVSGIRLGFMPLRDGRRPRHYEEACDVAFSKGDELGWFRARIDHHRARPARDRRHRDAAAGTPDPDGPEAAAFVPPEPRQPIGCRAGWITWRAG